MTGLSHVTFEQQTGPRVFAVITDEVQKLDIGFAALAQRGFAQRRGQTRVLHGLQQALVNRTEVLDALLWLVKA